MSANRIHADPASASAPACDPASAPAPACDPTPAPAPACADAVSYTVAELACRGRSDVPDELVSNTHLIYSSPATLAFNSPGAEGFGVKRAGLAIPGSVMLLVAPGCCGRNTALVSSMPAYDNRFFYLMMDETDIVTSRHLKLIPQAVREVCESLPAPPSMVMICITCVDALLGTDMERVCGLAQTQAGVPVRPCYMYALTREGRKPPMVHVRQSLYSLLQPRAKRSTTVNLLGFFSPLADDCELYDLLRQAGVKKVNELSRCADYDEYLRMAEANFNLVLDPEARFAADDLDRRLGIPSIELVRLYQIDKIESQYRAFANVLYTKLDDARFRDEAVRAVQAFFDAHGPLTFAIGECMNGNPFELACALVSYGMHVSELYATVTNASFVYLKRLGKESPETRVFSNLEPTMLYYDSAQAHADVTIGRDAAYYHPGCPNVAWNSDVQPFGYAGLIALLAALDEALANSTDLHVPTIGGAR